MIDIRNEKLLGFSNIEVMKNLYNYLKTIPKLKEITFGMISDKTPAIAMVCGLCVKRDYNVVGNYYVDANFSIIYKVVGTSVDASLNAMNEMIEIIELLENIITLPTMGKNQDAIRFELTKSPSFIEKGEDYTLYSMELRFLYYQY